MILIFGFKTTDDKLKKTKKPFDYFKKDFIFAPAIGEMAEWSNALVLKTSEGHTSGGSNPSFSAKPQHMLRFFYFILKIIIEICVYF